MNMSFSGKVSVEQVAKNLESLRNISLPTRLAENVLLECGLVDGYFRLATLAGDVFVAFNECGISYIESVMDTGEFEEGFLKRFRRRAVPITDPPERLTRQIRARLGGDRSTPPRFDLRRSTAFQRAVLMKALEIPFGQVRPYSWIAREIGSPLAHRAVGTALATNPVPLLIPCHRVVRNDGVIGNYGLGGPTVKRRLLQAEGAEPDSLESLARRGVHYFGSDTTRIFCYPSCAHARRITDKHRMHFRDLAQARQWGYRPCKVCRPDEPMGRQPVEPLGAHVF